MLLRVQEVGPDCQFSKQLGLWELESKNSLGQTQPEAEAQEQSAPKEGGLWPRLGI